MWVQPPTNPSDLDKFVVAFKSGRKRECLRLLTRSIESRLARNAHPDEKMVDTWIRPYQRVLGKAELPEDSNFAAATAAKNRQWDVITVCLGTACKTTIFDRSGHPILMPVKLEWPGASFASPSILPCGTILLQCSRIGQEGMEVGTKLIWVRIHHGRAQAVGSFEGTTNLDFGAAEITGNIVCQKTVDEPESFQCMSTAPLLQRVTKWDCANGFPHLVKVSKLNVALRAVDEAIFSARKARHPTVLQRRIRKLFPLRMQLDDNDIMTKRDSVTIDDVSFGLKGSHVIAVQRIRNSGTSNSGH